MNHFFTAFSLIPFYLLGAFPTGFLLARLKGVDIRSQGSGNVGATNVARVLGKGSGVLTLIADIAKGALGVLIAMFLTSQSGYHAMVAIVVVSGHCFSLPPRLKGGKGVATALGCYLVLVPSAAAFATVVFLLIFGLFRIVSISSVTAALSTPLFALFLNESDERVMGLAAIGLLIVWKHRTNLTRLSEGKEPVFRSGKS